MYGLYYTWFEVQTLIFVQVCNKESCGLTFSQRGNLKVGKSLHENKFSLIKIIHRLICAVTLAKSLTPAAFAVKPLLNEATCDLIKKHTNA